ncbi:arginine--tRNA ligase [Nitratifractor sp.]|uniref:arginine--tRNA ligase n=1 Tax=Nitratifractor sp. TaxID=2268144 RepID=UPI0025F063DD|nr:arginine--tRNA ligase [Nitratifractor sp.]
MQIKSQLNQLIQRACEQAEIPAENVQVNEAGKPEFGDYQFNGAMALAKRLGRNPREIAQSIVEAIEENEILDRVEIAGPGFINLHLRADWLAAGLDAAAQDERLGVGHFATPRKVVVDYSSPNMAKQMHVGHLRSTIIGDSLANLFAFLGDEVIRQNHIGDWGTQFGMLIAYLEELGEGAEGSLHDLEEFYKAAKKRFDEDAAFADKSREYVVKLQGGDVRCLHLWENFIDKSLGHCEEVYSKLHVKLTREDVRAESSYNDDLEAIVKDLEAKGLLQESQGAKVVFTEGEENPLIIQKSDGGFLYATTDLAAIRFRVAQLGAKRISYVVDARQAGHFQQVFTVARLAGYAPEDVQLEHVSFGMMLDKSGRPFKTRDGGTVKLIDLLEEAVDRAKGAITQREAYSEEELEKIAEIVGIGAVKYSDLSINRESNYIFDWDRMLSLEGNTSLYQQYAYARIRSIFRKYQGEVTGTVKIGDELERRLALKLLQLEDVLRAAAREAMPHYITTYLYELATLFMKFYENNPILREDVPEDLRQSRLILARTTAKTLRLALEILGIKVLERL